MKSCKICGQPKDLLCGEGCDAGEDWICKDHPCKHFTPDEARKLWELAHPPHQPGDWFKHAQQIGAIQWEKDKKKE